MYILGIACFYHDASATLLKDGQIIAACEEERFTRVKHSSEFPINAINFCLQKASITVDDLDYVGFYEKPFIKFERIISSHIACFPTSLAAFIKFVPLWLRKKLWIQSIIRKELDYNGKILFIEHHTAHAASTFLVSGFQKAAILTVDGTGEWATTTYGVGNDKDIQIMKEIKFPHSLGLLYSAITAYLGFRVNNGEGKIMGLASYGKPKYIDIFRKIVDVKEDGSFNLDMSYFAYHKKLYMPGKKLIRELGLPRVPESKLEDRHWDIAASLQAFLEETLIKMANYLHRITHLDALCIAGGVGLNCVANGKILSQTPFKEIFIQPASGDGGTSIGVAFYIYNTILKNDRNFILKNAYLGPEFSNEDIKTFLDSKNISCDYLKGDELKRQTAKLLSEDKIVGWFQGQMEFGPRALGNRSILANPRNPSMKDILNARVKHREGFRPYAPSVLLDDSNEYFDLNYPSPFMLLAGEVKAGKEKEVPSITHVDNTARVQTVSKEENPIYYDLINEFKKITSVPVILNTSFNIRGEPIVCSPEDAYNCFANTEMDYLVLGNYLIDKKKVEIEPTIRKEVKKPGRKEVAPVTG